MGNRSQGNINYNLFFIVMVNKTKEVSDKDMVTTSAGIAVSSEVAAIFKENAKKGSENLSSAMPQLKVSEANSNNLDVEGNLVPAGNFYYSPTKKFFKSVDVSIMTISRGFFAMDNSKEPKPKFTQLVGGMMIEEMQPFIMFISGTRLAKLWEFGKEISPFTKNTTSPIPMFGFKVTLELEELKTANGFNHVVVFKLTRNDKNQVEIINDPILVNVLARGIDQINETFDSFIAQKEVDKTTHKLLKDIPKSTVTTLDDEFPNQKDPAIPTDEELAAGSKEDVNPEDTPF